MVYFCNIEGRREGMCGPYPLKKLPPIFPAPYANPLKNAPLENMAQVSLSVSSGCGDCGIGGDGENNDGHN